MIKKIKYFIGWLAWKMGFDCHPNAEELWKQQESKKFPPRTFRGHRILTEEELAKMDCPFPPEPGYDE